MSFLFPLYLLGAAAIAVPVLLHLRRRPPKDSLSFSSLMFLEKSPERLTRHTRIERWLLLLLRCLALIVLALLFSRPFSRSVSLSSDGEAETRAMILLDGSASMKREDLWKRALAACENSIQSFRDTDGIALAVFDEKLHVAGDFQSWKGLSSSARWSSFQTWLGAKHEVLPSWRATDIGNALTGAVDLLSGSQADRKEIVLISDFQEGAARDSLNQLAWPGEVTVRYVPITAKREGNISVNLAASMRPGEGISADEDRELAIYRVRLTNSIASETDHFVVEWENTPGTRTDGFLAPGTSRVMMTPPIPREMDEAILHVSGDHHDFDNRVYVATTQPRPLPILYLSDKLDASSAGTPLFYLERALNETASLAPTVTGKSLGDASPDWGKSAVVIVHGDWPESIAERLHKFVKKGGLVLALPSPKTTPASFRILMEEPDWKLAEAPSGKGYVMLEKIDFEHPILAPFARAKIRDFTKIRFWKHRVLTIPGKPDENTSILAEFDSGSAALVEKKIGRGSVIVFFSGWEPSESQLALSSKFVPILYSIFENAGYHARSTPTLYAGRATYRDQEGNIVKAEKPGFYETKEKGGRPRKLAVNLYPSEGNTTPFDPNLVLSDFGVAPSEDSPVSVNPGHQETSKKRLKAEEKERKQKLWKWLVVFVLLVLISETWLAGRARKTTVTIA